MKANASCSVTKWEEATIREIPGPMKMTKASVIYRLSGDLEGNATAEYLMFYRHSDSKDQHDSSTTYVGLIHFQGNVLGRSGTLVLEDLGSFEAGTANSRLRIAEGSGTGELKGMQGTGFYQANGNDYRVELDCDFHRYDE